jgi:hypothetical protein
MAPYAEVNSDNPLTLQIKKSNKAAYNNRFASMPAGRKNLDLYFRKSYFVPAFSNLPAGKQVNLNKKI